MSRKIAEIAWDESAEVLYERYHAERDVAARKRLQAVGLVRQGMPVTGAARTVGVGRRTLTRWLDWYREGGLPTVLARVPGALLLCRD
jgi:transposase-like protein